MFDYALKVYLYILFIYHILICPNCLKHGRILTLRISQILGWNMTSLSESYVQMKEKVIFSSLAKCNVF